MKKQFVAWLLMISLLLGCCGAIAEGKTDLVVYHWSASGAFEAIIKAFQEKYPNVSVTYKTIPDADDRMLKMTTILASGEQVDVCAQTSPDYTIQRVNADLYEPLNAYFEAAGIDFEKEFGSTIAALETINGNIYAVPYGTKIWAVHYNKKMFDEAGVPYPQDGWTWDDYRETAKKLTKGEGPNKIYGAIEYGPELTNPIWCMQAELKLGLNAIYKNANESNWDDPAFLESLKFWIAMQDEDQSIKHIAEFPAEKLELLSNRTNQFYKGKFAMMIAPSYNILQSTFPENAHDFEVGVVSLPKISADAPQASTIAFSDFSIPKSSKHKQEAFDFIKFYVLDRPDIPNKAKGMQMPAPLKDPAIQAELDKNIYTAPSFNYDQAYAVYNNPDQVLQPDITFSTITTAKTEIMTYMVEEIKLAFLGEKTPEEALASLKERSDAAIKLANEKKK